MTPVQMVVPGPEPVTAPGQAFSKGFTLGGTKSANAAWKTVEKTFQVHALNTYTYIYIMYGLCLLASKTPKLLK